MSYQVKQGDIFGRIGSELGKGLAESIPKEVERGRLASGLQALEGETGNLTPLQYYTRALQIPGLADRPQVVQSLAELAKQQQIRNAYGKTKGGAEMQQPQSQQGNQAIQGVQFGQLPGQIQRSSPQGQTIPTDLSREQEAVSNQPAAAEHPLAEKFIPATPWNQQSQDAAINEAFETGKATNFQEALAFANNKRELYERAPEEYRKQLDYRKGVDKEVEDLYDKQLQDRLQKQGKETFADIPGDLQLNIKKMAKNAVATGKMTPEQAAEYYSKRSLDLAKDKAEALKIANRDILDRFLPNKKEETIKRLMYIAKNFEDMGSEEDFFNFLTTDKLDENGQQLGMGLSPGAAAVIQYRGSPKVKNLLKNTKISPKNRYEDTRAFAEKLFNEMTPKDSFLASARRMKQQDPNFDENAYFDYLRENKDKFSSNKRLDREVQKGVSDFFPNWRDIGLFPAFTKSVAND